ncbi:MAG: 3-dehydroquinate synthase [Desulfobacteraceae bacterium]|nr:3-dehydroquinate synthase [Desulfobacteraceae bacterium]MBC2753992.1 3-dehydroquinate synthase [Desulfobacteraceae bacterium]
MAGGQQRKGLTLKKIEIQGDTGNSQIFVGERLENLASYLHQNQVVIITDDHVARFYQKDFPKIPVIRIGTGEGVKTLDTVERVYQQLIELEADRSVFLLGIGGGIVCDVTGFAASTYLRGVRFGYVPTTLLAQVDASVGGKTGVNFMGYKNMVGVFNQPEFVICDPAVLKTLPRRELASGFAEIVKHAAIADESYFTYLEKNAANALALDPDVLQQIIYDSVVIKADIVSRDETEKGERRKLNFGHTFGHAMEKTAGIFHGEAVSIGMMVATLLSVSKNMLTENEVGRIKSLLSVFNLPVEIETDKAGILDALARDKKREGDGIYFVLLSGIGHAVVEKITLAELEKVLYGIP